MDKYVNKADGLANKIRHYIEATNFDLSAEIAQALRSAHKAGMIEAYEDAADSEKVYALMADPAPHIEIDCCRAREIAMAKGSERAFRSKAAALRKDR